MSEMGNPNGAGKKKKEVGGEDICVEYKNRDTTHPKNPKKKKKKNKKKNTKKKKKKKKKKKTKKKKKKKYCVKLEAEKVAHVVGFSDTHARASPRVSVTQIRNISKLIAEQRGVLQKVSLTQS